MPNTGDRYVVWIGLRRSGGGDFEWSDGTPTDYTNWLEGVFFVRPIGVHFPAQYIELKLPTTTTINPPTPLTCHPLE